VALGPKPLAAMGAPLCGSSIAGGSTLCFKRALLQWQPCRTPVANDSLTNDGALGVQLMSRSALPYVAP